MVQLFANNAATTGTSSGKVATIGGNAAGAHGVVGTSMAHLAVQGTATGSHIAPTIGTSAGVAFQFWGQASGFHPGAKHPANASRTAAVPHDSRIARDAAGNRIASVEAENRIVRVRRAS